MLRLLSEGHAAGGSCGPSVLRGSLRGNHAPRPRAELLPRTWHHGTCSVTPTPAASRSPTGSPCWSANRFVLEEDDPEVNRGFPGSPRNTASHLTWLVCSINCAGATAGHCEACSLVLPNGEQTEDARSVCQQLLLTFNQFPSPGLRPSSKPPSLPSWTSVVVSSLASSLLPLIQLSLFATQQPRNPEARSQHSWVPNPTYLGAKGNAFTMAHQATLNLAPLYSFFLTPSPTTGSTGRVAGGPLLFP